MRVIRFSQSTNELRLVPTSFDDLYLLARIIGKGDAATASTTRRFRPSEGDTGVQKDVVIELRVEKVEIDRNSGMLRLSGKILSGRPEEFVRMGSYHTLSIGEGDMLTVRKEDGWKEYTLGMVKQAVHDSRRTRLGVVAMDDEKATFAYVRGYGIEVAAEIYSGLSKKMKEAEYGKARSAYFEELAKKIGGMRIDLVVIAGPGFAKDDFGKYIESKGIRLEKRVVYTAASDAERSGVREAVQGAAVAKLLENEKVRREFDALNAFLAGLNMGQSFHGRAKVREALSDYNAGMVMVNDSVLNDEEVKSLLDTAYRQRAEIMVFNSEDDAGMQLHGFGDIAAVGKGFVKKGGSSR